MSTQGNAQETPAAAPLAEGRTPQQLFRAAALLVEQALIKLDTREATCQCCGDRRFTNFPHAKAYKAFTDVPHRLREHATALDDATTPGRR